MNRLTGKIDSVTYSPIVSIDLANELGSVEEAKVVAQDNCNVKLGRLEDLEQEVGMPLDELLNLIGETVYEVHEKTMRVYPFYVQFISYNAEIEDYLLLEYLCDDEFVQLCLAGYNENWFKTEEEAERKLEEMKK